MRSVLLSLVPALFWAGCLLRLPAARRSGPQRTLCLSLAAFAAALTLNVPTVYLAFDRAVGVPNLANLAEHVLGVWGVAGVLRLARQLTATAAAGPVKHVVPAAGLATAALTALFVLAPTPVEAPSFTAAYGHHPEVVAYWMVTIGYFGAALAELARLSLRYAGRAPRPSLRAGLYVLGAGVVLGVAYSLSKLAELAARQLPRAGLAEHMAATAGHILLGVGGVAMGAGLLIPAFGPRLAAARQAAQAYVTLWRLRPLWETLRQANPHIVLGPPPTRREDLLSLRQLEPRLYRRVIEIRDGLLTLRPYVADDVAQSARAAAADAGLVGSERDATADACWLAAAVAAKRAGHAPDATSDPYIRGASDLPGEAALLCQVADAWRHSPVVRDFAASRAVSEENEQEAPR